MGKLCGANKATTYHLCICSEAEPGLGIDVVNNEYFAGITVVNKQCGFVHMAVKAGGNRLFCGHYFVFICLGCQYLVISGKLLFETGYFLCLLVDLGLLPLEHLLEFQQHVFINHDTFTAASLCLGGNAQS